MRMSKEEFIEQYKKDKAKKDIDNYFANRAADDFRYEGKGKCIRKKYRQNFYGKR